MFSIAVEAYRVRFFSSKQTFPAGYFNGNRKAEKLKAYERMIDEKISKVDLSYIILETVEQNPMKLIFKRDYKKNNFRPKEENFKSS